MASVCNALFTVKEKSGTIANSGKGGCKKANAKNGTNCGMCHAINDDKTRCNLPADGRTNYCKKCSGLLSQNHATHKTFVAPVAAE